MNVLNSG